MLTRLSHLSKSELNRIGQEIADAFLAEPNSFSLSLGRSECIRYFQAMVRYYYKGNCLYASSPEQEGWIVYYRRKEEPGIPAKLLLMTRLFCSIPYSSLVQTGLSPKGWTYYKDLFADETDYIDIALVAVKKPCQKQGFLRQLLQEPMALSETLRIPCILETDTDSNAQKYEHLGFRTVKEQAFRTKQRSELHLYAMEYRPATS